MTRLILATIFALAFGASAQAQDSAVASGATALYIHQPASSATYSSALSMSDGSKVLFESDANGKLVKADWPAIKKACDGKDDPLGTMTVLRAISCALVAASHTKPGDWK